MIDCTMLNKDLLFLKNIIGLKMENYRADFLSKQGLVFENLYFSVSDGFELRSEEEMFEGCETEIMRFHTEKLSKKEYAKKTASLPIKMVRKTINDVIVARDVVSVSLIGGEPYYDIVHDDAIAFRFDTYDLVCYRDFSSTDFINVEKVKDYRDVITSVEDVEYDYSDEDNHEYFASCLRIEISLKDWKQEDNER